MSSDFDESYYAIRIGSLILHNIGQLLPHQLNSGHFHNRNYIYPVINHFLNKEGEEITDQFIS